MTSLDALADLTKYDAPVVRRNFKWWHEAIIDDMLAFPLDTLATRGARLNYNPTFLSTLINSDMFKAAYEHRRREYTANLDQSLTQKTAAVAGKALDIMLETLEAKRGAIPFGVLSDTVDKTLSRLGYGVKPQGTTVNVVGDNAKVAVLPAVNAAQLSEARSALRAAEQLRALEPPSPAESRSAAPTLDLTAEPDQSSSEPPRR